MKKEMSKVIMEQKHHIEKSDDALNDIKKLKSS
jgi:hypothetical protein